MSLGPRSSESLAEDVGSDERAFLGLGNLSTLLVGQRLVVERCIFDRIEPGSRPLGGFCVTHQA
jgi:hypothetical protein